MFLNLPSNNSFIIAQKNLGKLGIKIFLSDESIAFCWVTDPGLFLGLLVYSEQVMESIKSHLPGAGGEEVLSDLVMPGGMCFVEIQDFLFYLGAKRNMKPKSQCIRHTGQS